MTSSTGEPPQDAPVGQPWTAQPWPQPAPPGSAPDAPASHEQSDAGGDPGGRGASPGRLRVAPSGPNWALAGVGLVLLLAAGAQLAYLLGYRPDGVRVGPQALIALGAVLLLVGALGSWHRRAGGATRRRRRATRCR